MRYARNVIHIFRTVRGDDLYLVRSPCRIVIDAVAEAIDGRERICGTRLGGDSHDGDETLVALNSFWLRIRYLREACAHVEKVRADGDVAGGIDASSFEIASATRCIDGGFINGERYRVRGKKFAIALANFVPGSVGTAQNAVTAMHAGAVHANVAAFRNQDCRGKIAIRSHIHEMVAREPDNLRSGTVHADSFRDCVMADILRLVAENRTDAVFAIGHAEARHFCPSARRTAAQRVEHPHGIASTIDDVRIREMHKVPADSHRCGIATI